MSQDWTRPLAPALEAALAEATARTVASIASDLPADVRIAPEPGGLALSGRALAQRALTDTRLRDFAAIVRAAR